MKPDVTVETKVLETNMRALGIAAGQAIKAVVKEVTGLYLQSAANATPKAKRGKRRITSGTARYRNNIFELVPNASPTAPGDQRRYWIQIPRERKHAQKPRLATIDSFGGNSYWGFKNRSDAAPYTDITYRGLLQASFYGMLPAVGKKIPAKYKDASHLVAVPGIYLLENGLQHDKPFVVTHAKARGIGGLEAMVKPFAISKVNARIPFIARKVKGGMKRYKEAGGLHWDNTVKDYVS